MENAGEASSSKSLIMTNFTSIGQPTPLQDGRAKVTGAAQYLPDIPLPGMLHARFVASIFPHARIRSIDTETALATPGVVAVLTASDLPDIVPSSRDQLLLARERVLFVGQPIALVLATSEALAEDGARMVAVDYEPLPAPSTIDEAMAEGAPLVWPDGMPGASEEAGAHGADVGEDEGANTLSNTANRNEFSRGDILRGFEQADVVVERVFTTPAAHQNYIETQGMLVQPDSQTGGATVWSSTQAPFRVREQVAKVLDVPESDVRVIATTIGGAFGGKFLLYEPLVALAARIVGHPVRLVLTRMEDLLAGNPAHAARFHVRFGAKKDGTFTALQAEIFFDGGCFPSAPAGLAAVLLGNNYNIPNLSLESTEVLTFKPSGGAYRAPGAPQAAFAIESMIDEMATALNMNSLALRMQNAVQAGDPTTHGQEWPPMGMRDVLTTLQNHPAWQGREAAREAGRGVGIAIGSWPGATEPAAAACALNRDGFLHVHIGSVDLTGTWTGFALIAAESFGISPDRVRVVAGDTSTAPYAGGAGGSKITYSVGPAIMQAAAEARQQALAIAAEEFEAAPEDLEIVNGTVRVRGVPDRQIPLGDVAGKTMQFGSKYAPVLGHGRHADTTLSPTFCAQLAEVEVDSETGIVDVHRLVIVQDVGRAINPLTIKGQMMGGATQGLGWALYEQLVYDGGGQLLTGSWMDYTVPHFTRAASKIETVIVEVLSDHGPFGARGVGEPPIIPTAAAVANAIADATGTRPKDLPMTPPRVLAALKGAQT